MILLLAAVLNVHPQESLLDEPVSIAVNGLMPQQEVEIRAKASTTGHQTWARYRSDSDGKIDLEHEVPLAGTYNNADGMGLFCSMPEDCEGDVQIDLLVSGEKIASTSIHRGVKDSLIRRLPLREKGIVGTLFLPISKAPLPVIVTLSGSNGGISEKRAKLLAAHGFATLALGYFGAEDLPSNLENIPLEYFGTAFALLNKFPEIDSRRIGIYGVSRGAELALILGTIYAKEISAIVADVPSSVMYGGLSETPIPAWTWKGHPLPAAKCAHSDLSLGYDSEHPVATTDCFFEGMKNDPAAFESAAIPVEKIGCPLLLISGGDDQMWPSSFFAEGIVARLDSFGSAIQREHLYYPHAGHAIGVPYRTYPESVYFHPMSQRWFSMGGSSYDTELASRDSWRKLIHFFQVSLKSEEL